MPEATLSAIADRYGTPLYLYDLDAIAARARLVTRYLAGHVELLYAVKANPCESILRTFLPLVDGLDISSGGELKAGLAAGWEASRMSFAGPGKNLDELSLAIQTGCGSISVESRDDFERILEAGQKTGRVPNVSLRVNPLRLDGPFALKMGGKPTQFGVDEEVAPELLRVIATEALRGRVEYAGLHIYSGTQCLDAHAIIGNVRNSLRIAQELEAASGLAAPGINLGGGFGIAYYEGQTDLDLAATCTGVISEIELFRTVKPLTRFRLELGRYLVAPAGWYLSRVLAVKASRGKVFAILDGGMHQHLSASGNLGQTIKRNYSIRNLGNPSGEPRVTELAGCLCTPIDVLGFGAILPQARTGDLICIENSGAYGFTASPLFFLGHDTPREICLHHGESSMTLEAFNLSEIASACADTDVDQGVP